jgi:TrmH family RNA methyltransferase
MLSKSFEKYVNSLKQKKYRISNKRFIAEGDKIVLELLEEKVNAEKLLATTGWLEIYRERLPAFHYVMEEISEHEMKRISSLVHPSGVLLVAEIPEAIIDREVIRKKFSLVLDGIQDPGNMGTIIRVADWFGIPYIFCSEDCVDSWNPKVVQASMGSVARIKVIEIKLEQLFEEHADIPVLAATLDGENIFKVNPGDSGFLLIGSEAHGISSSLEKFIHRRITIPKSGKAESLNAAVAAGIVCAVCKRRG